MAGKSKKPKLSAQTGGIDADKAISYVERIEVLHEEIASHRGSYMAKAKTIREEIKELLGDAKDEGIPPKAIQAAVSARSLEKKRRDLESGLDLDVGAAFKQIVEAFEDTPLGQAASNVTPINAEAGAAA